MKKYLLALLSVIYYVSSAQNSDYNREELIAKEQKKFAAKMAIGNINPNTLNYDLRYQRMDLTIDPAVYNIGGSVTSHFIPTQQLSSIYFDLSAQLTVSQVTYHGNNLSFQQLGTTNEIKINFSTPIPSAVKDSLTIHYSGAPATGNNAFFANYQSGVAVLSTLSEPYGAQDWFPTKQSLNDKIERFDFKITTPSQYSVAANGKLMAETLLPNAQKLTFWRTDYPMAAYLAALSITNFTKLNDTIGNPPFPFVNYIYPSTAADAVSMANIDWTKQCMTTFENYFGPYPFRNEKYGHMEFEAGGGMEHQTMTSMGGWGKGLIAHELAHQWFGDKVTCGTWNDIWLNEGFATFGEHLANEKLLMPTADFLNYLLSQKNFITSSTGGSTYVADANLSSVNTIFNGRLSYSKGGYILRMIKWILTDPVFYQALKDYHQRPNLAYNYVTTSDFTQSLLLSTGRDFTGFFNDWVYGQGYPTYNIKWKQTANQTITLLVSQTPSHPSVGFFELPLPIKVNGTAGQVAYLKPEHTANNQYFTYSLGFDVASVQFNYEYQIIEKNSTVVMDNNLATVEVQAEEIMLFPSPAKNEIFLKGVEKTTDFKIYSAEGRLIKSGIYTPNVTININDLVSGSYVFSILEKNIKFIKK